jgi:TetR/AcrR family transcriptional regulator, cholesterol catabolism regulator
MLRLVDSDPEYPAYRMSATPRDERVSTVIDVVIELIETEGYDAVQVRTVAKRARVSLATLYSFFPSRDELIAAAVAQWLQANVDRERAPLAADATFYDALMYAVRAFFEPWEEYPTMLDAFYRVRRTSAGEGVHLPSTAAFRSTTRRFEHLDPQYVEDVQATFGYVCLAVIARFADKQLDANEMIPVIERAVRVLTSAPVEAISAG